MKTEDKDKDKKIVSVTCSNPKIKDFEETELTIQEIAEELKSDNFDDIPDDLPLHFDAKVRFKYERLNKYAGQWTCSIDSENLKNTNIGNLLNKDFDPMFRDLEMFMDCIPKVAKLIGVPVFMEKMGFGNTQYYGRLKNKDTWKLSELKRAKEIFNEQNLVAL